jgi:hypothetical protein
MFKNQAKTKIIKAKFNQKNIRIKSNQVKLLEMEKNKVILLHFRKT